MRGARRWSAGRSRRRSLWPVAIRRHSH